MVAEAEGDEGGATREEHGVGEGGAALEHEGRRELHVEGGVEGVDKAGQVEGVEAALHERRVETDLVHVEGVGQQLADVCRHRFRIGDVQVQVCAARFA